MLNPTAVTSQKKRATKPHVFRGHLVGLKRLMKANDIDDEALAAKLQRATRTIQAWRVGEHNPPSQILGQLAEALGTTVGDLYTE